MNKLQPGDRTRLSGGYDMDPLWLRERDAYSATILKFFDNWIEKRPGDERLSAVIEFDVPLSFAGLQGKYAVILGRWQGRRREKQGIVHACLADHEISGPSEPDTANSRWMESHSKL